MTLYYDEYTQFCYRKNVLSLTERSLSPLGPKYGYFGYNQSMDKKYAI